MLPCRIYVSLPVISSLRGNVRNTGFGFHDVFYTDPLDQPGDYTLDLDKLDNELRSMNNSLANADVDLLGLGFPLEKGYITFLISSHSSSQLSYPHDVVLLQDGYWNLNAGTPDPINLHQLEANSTAWNSIGISASREVRKGFRVGARVKYLNGMANVTTPQSAINLYASATISYTLMNNKYNQIGTGLAFGNRGAQFYVITDNIVVRYIKDTQSSLRWPYNARMLSLRFGMNLFFGCNDKNDNPGGKKRWQGVKSRDECPAYW